MLQKFLCAHWLIFIVNKQQAHGFIIYVMCQRTRVDNLLMQKLTSVFSCVCPVIDIEFSLNIIKVVRGSIQLSPCGSTATLTKL